MSQKPRVCIIGCGPSGMSVLYHFSKLTQDTIPDIVCYEKQKTWGGQWNPSWRIGKIIIIIIITTTTTENIGTKCFEAREDRHSGLTNGRD